MEITKYRTFIADHTRELFYEADNYLSKNKVDFIIATGEPWVSFRYAHLLSKKHNIPWASDYRDGWNTDVSMNEISWGLKNFIFFLEGPLKKNMLNQLHLFLYQILI